MPNYLIKTIMKKIYLWLLLVCSVATISAQTTLISPSGDGGFETGSTFAANGWTAVNHSSHTWQVSGVSVPATGANAAFVSGDGGVTNGYVNSVVQTSHFYKDVTIPAGETKINLTFKYKGTGEAGWDRLLVYAAPTSVTPVAGTPAASSTTLTGATLVFTQPATQATYLSTTVYVPASFAGTTTRLIFTWQNDGGGGVNPPASVDDISLVSSVPGTYISVATGNWSAGATWDAGSAPTFLDNAIVSTGHVVTVDATGQAIKDLAVNGTLVYGATPAAFNVNGNLTVNAGGLVNVFNGTTGKSLVVSGNIVNDGRIDLSVSSSATSTTTQGNLTLNGAAAQTVSGAGTFGGTVSSTTTTNTVDVIRFLTCANTSTATPNIVWSFNNVKLMNGINTTGARINLGSNKLILGNYAAAGATSTMPVGTGILPGAKFSRWWTAAATGTAIAVGADPTNATSRYPFITSTGLNRAMYITRTNATGAVAGELAVVYTDASTTTTGLSVVDGAYTINNRYDGNWTVSNEGTAVSSSSYSLALLAPGGAYAINGNSRVMGASAAISGAHQNGTTTVGAQRTTVTQADLLAGPLYIGVASVDSPIVSVANGDWNVASTWSTGVVPTCTDVVSIAPGTTVTVNSAANNAKNVTVFSGGTLAVASGDLTVGCTFNNNFVTNNGTLTVSGGTLTINGNLMNNAGSTFNQSGGDIVVDGSDGTTAGSVLTGTPLVRVTANAVANLNLTAGTITIVDPHYGATSTSDYALSISQGGAAGAANPLHTVKFGNGVSTTAGGHTNGFYVYLFPGSFYYSLGNVTVDALTGTNRFVKTTSNIGILGNLIITSGEYQLASTTYVAGDITNNGTIVATSTLNLATYIGTASATANAQTISGTGVFKNLATAQTANLSSLTVNNTNATGVTLNVPLSVSGTLTMTSGLINTTNTNLLTLGTATAAGTLSGTPSATNMVKGPFARTIASGNTNSGYIHFPVGKSAYNPIWLAPATTAVSVMKAEAFDANAGTADTSITTLSSTKRWEAPLVSGTITDVNVRLSDAAMIATNIPVQAPTAAGVYTNSFGSVATYAAGPPVTVQSNTALATANYTGFLSYAISNACSGTPAPGNTVASSTTICLGSSVNLSLQNATTGTGVTYQWQSSPDGVAAYTNIATATNATLTVTPTAATYYQCIVTCATGPASGTSTPVQITFTNNIASTTPGTRCGTGTAVLGATGNSGATIKWYDAATAGNLVGTGSPFTTPSISATTTYYAAAESATAGTATLGLGATNSSTTAASFFPGSWGGAKTQYIIKASELSQIGLGSGNITSLGFEPTNSGQAYQGFSVSLGNTSLNAMTTAFVTSGLTQVYLGTEANDAYTPIANSVNNLAFGTGTGSAASFNWDGTSNIVVSISWSRVPAASTSTSTIMKVDNVGFVSSAYDQADNLTPAAMLASTTADGTGSNRPRFSINGQLLCSSARVAVTATVTPAPALTVSSNVGICNGASTTLTVSSANDPNYTYTWSPATGLSSTTGASVTANPSTTTVYTVTANDAGSGCATTGTVTVTVNVAPTAVTVTPATATICPNAIQTLVASGGNVTGVATIGTVTTLTTSTGEQTAFCNRRSNYWSQTIYTAAELSAAGVTAGNITAMAYNITTIGDAATNANFTVKIGASATAAFASTSFVSTASFTTVYGPSTYTHTATGWQTITFATPYVWDGISDIVVNVTHDGIDTTNNAQTYYTATSDNKSLYGYNYTGATTTGTLSLNRLDIRFDYIAPAAVTWSPTTGLYTDAGATVAYTGTAATTVYAKPSANQTYTATATLGTCTKENTSAITVTAVDNTVAQVVDTLTANQAGATYQWFTCPGNVAISGETAQSFTATATGDYGVTVTVSGCSVDSACTTISTLGVNTFDIANGFKAYPNPVSDVLTIEYTSDLTSVAVYNLLGQQVLAKNVNATTTQVNMSELNAGTYLVKVSSGTVSKTLKVVKK